MHSNVRKEGFANRRHDNIRDFLVCLLNEVCISVQAEPHLINLSGEELFFDTASQATMQGWTFKPADSGGEGKMHSLMYE